MKICPKCNCGNNDNAINCKDCGTVIANICVIDSQQVLDNFTKKEEYRLYKKKIIQLVSTIIIVLAYLILYIRALTKGEFRLATMIVMLFPTTGYLSIFHPKVLFVLKNIFIIDNIDEVDLTDFYLLTSIIGGIILIVTGLVCMFVISL